MALSPPTAFGRRCPPFTTTRASIVFWTYTTKSFSRILASVRLEIVLLLESVEPEIGGVVGDKGAVGLELSRLKL